MSPRAFLVVAVIAAGCRSEIAAPAQKWTCPMHPQYVSDKPGDCPICSMKLVPVKQASGGHAAPQKCKPLYYRSPMNPQQTSPVPRKDEMGMDYIPVCEESKPSVTITPEQQRLIGMKTIEVKRGEIAGKLRTNARVTFDEQRLQKVTARFSGFVEQLSADFTGKLVHKGDPLVSIYSPDLLATEQEFLLALNSRESLAQSGLPDMVQAARQRLRLFGISDAEIDEIAKRGKPIRALTLHAPITGFITSKTVMAGARVEPDQALFEIADLSRVWLLADIYEYELPRLELGETATFTLSYWPDRIWRGRVSYIFPTVDEKTRTVRVRIEVDNPRTELKPEMFGDVEIATVPRRALLVPEDAVIDTGARKLVFVSLGEGKLEPREIQVGIHADGKYEVRGGLIEGERVATGANFLLDSESRLKSAVSGMTPPDGGAP